MKIIVIGGGISGLAAAHRAGEIATERGATAEITLIEAADRVGGVIHTFRRDGFLLEAGPDNVLTTKPAGVALFKRLGLAEQILDTNPEHRRAMVVFRGKLAPLPAGFQLVGPTQIFPFLASPLFSIGGKIRVLREYFLPPKGNTDDESLSSFIIRRFGKETLDRVVQPLISGIYTADPDTLSLKATFPRFLDMEAKHGSVLKAFRMMMKKKTGASGTGARYGLFVTLQEGLQSLIDALAEKIGAANIHVGQRVNRVSREAASGAWAVATESGKNFSADAVILAGSRKISAELLRPTSSDLADKLADLEYASAAVVHCAYKREDVPHPLDSFGFVVPNAENRNLVAATFSNVKYAGRAPDGHVLVRAFIGGEKLAEQLARDDAGMTAMVLGEFKSLLGITAAPLFTTIHRYPEIMPQYTVGHLDRVQTIRDDLKKLPGLQLAGNGFEGVGIPDCIQAGELAAEELWTSHD